MKMREGALRERERIIKEAKRDSLGILERRKGEANEIFRKILAEAEEEVELEKKIIITRGEIEASEYREKAKKNIDRAVERIVSKFEEELKYV
jgi:vacuolar-type H+-ATPase subunit H